MVRHSAIATFSWTGTDRAGKRIKGMTAAAGEQALRAELRRQGVVASRIRRPFIQRGGRVKPDDIASATRQLATMIGAGIPLVQAFDIIGASHETPAVQGPHARGEDRDGRRRHAGPSALARHPRHFDELYVNLVAAGEQAGALETLLEKIAAYGEATRAIRAKVRKALFYPAAVTAVAIAVTTILLIFVIPEFEALFDGFGAELPAMTRLVIDLSDFVRASGWALGFGVTAAGVIIMQSWKRSRAVRHRADRTILRVPGIGSIVAMAATARFARTLATTFAAGTPLVEALESVAKATGSIVYETQVMKIRDAVATGQRLQQAMKDAGVFPNMATRMIGVGEESGSLDDMAERVADFYEAQVENAVDSLSSLLEPLVMAALGVIVGGLVVAMYLPVFQMGQVI